MPARADDITTDCAVTQVSDGERFSLHMYYDICPESPHGQRVTYFRFTAELPGPGEVIVADRDGGNRQVVGRASTGGTHNGACQQWIDDDTLVYNDVRDGRPVGVVVTASGRLRREVPAAVEMTHEPSHLGLVPVRWSFRATRLDAEGVEDGIDRTDLDRGEVRRLLSMEQVWDAYPGAGALSGEVRASASLGHTKWAPDGSRFMFVLKNENARRKHPSLPRIKSIFVADRDGGSLRHVGAFGHHPNFTADGQALYASGTLEQNQPGLTVFPIDGGEPFVYGVPPCGHPTLREGQILTDLQEDADRASVLLYDTATGRRRTLASFPHRGAQHGQVPPVTPLQAKADPHPVWSRDGRRVYFVAKGRDGIATLFALNAK